MLRIRGATTLKDLLKAAVATATTAANAGGQHAGSQASEGTADERVLNKRNRDESSALWESPSRDVPEVLTIVLVVGSDQVHRIEGQSTQLVHPLGVHVQPLPPLAATACTETAAHRYESLCCRCADGGKRRQGSARQGTLEPK